LGSQFYFNFQQTRISQYGEVFGMKKKLFIILIVFFIFNCSSEKFHPMDINKGSVVKETTMSLQPGDDSYKKFIRNAGNSAHLLLGKYENQYASRILLKMSSFPDTAIVKAARITFYSQNILGDTLAAPFEAQMYEFDRSWTEGDTLLWNDINATPGQVLASAMIYPEASDTVVFEMIPEIVTKWMDTTQTNNGAWIECAGATFIKDFYSDESSVSTSLPIFRVTYATPNHPDSAFEKSYYLNADLFVLEDNSDAVMDTTMLYIGSGIGYRSYLNFNLDSLIERKDTINRAELILTINKELSLFDGTGANLLQATDSTYAVFGSSISVADDNSVTVNVTDIVRFWSYLDSRYPQNQLILYSTTEASSVDRVAFYSSAADSARIPKLRLVYSIPPTK